MLLSKAGVRRSTLAARWAMDPVVRATTDAAIVRFAGIFAASRRVDTVAAYVPIRGEPGGGPALPDALAATGARVLLPVLRDDLDLDWGRYSPDDLVPAGRGLLEPAGPRLGTAAIGEAALVFVPAVAVDRAGIRLGRGGGSYDRALARTGGLLVALLYPGELVDTLPAEPHDQPVHATYDGAHLEWTKAGRMTDHWHSTYRSANDGG